ncbi:MAG: hypothetical protein MUF18_04255 [Fimbriiglobus sp.]|jgi:uncharacterized protein YjbI with pentapeptide repeats|nr:hypothetical protein [Fimbriiglobus sp.]
MSEQELQLFTAPDIQPEEQAPERIELTPQEVLELLRAGKEVANARVRKLTLKGEFAQPVRFRNCALIQPCLDGAKFTAEVAFTHCSLDRLSVTRGATFAAGLDFGHSVLNKCNLTRLKVEGLFNAAFAEFKNKLAFSDNTFAGKVSFWEAKIHCWIDVKGCEFQAEADFRSVHCGQGFVLNRSTFRGDFLFRGSSVAKKFSADTSRFEMLLDLSKAKLPDFCYLEGIESGPTMRFAFLNAVAERILVKPEQLTGRLASEQEGRHADAMHEYGTLKKSYQNLHRYDHEDWAFYRFKVNQRRGKPCRWLNPFSKVRRFCDWLFLDVGCGYGTHPGRAVRMALLIILGFAALYALNVESFYAEKPPFDGEKTELGNRVMIGFVNSVSVFTSGMGGIREIAKGWINVAVMVESVMGTLLFGLFIVAFSRKVIR